MPAAAVIPAPIAYIKVVAVEKLVVGFWERRRLARLRRVLSLRFFPFHCGSVPLVWCGAPRGIVYFEKIRVFKAGKFV